MTWKLYAVVSAAAFVGTYFMSSPKGDVSHPSAAVAAQTARQSKAATEIEALADGLHVSLHAGATYRAPGRDPFHFQARVQRPAFVPPPAVAAPLPPPPPPLPMLNLTGLATSVVDGQSQRSAVISLPSGVLIVREGESVAGLYKVLSIGDDSIELEATTDGSHRTLRLSGR